MISITVDVDWAPDAVIHDTLDLLSRCGISATLFATHRASILRAAELDHEVAIHPNFNGLLAGEKGSVDRILGDLLEVYPSARGIRSHSMTQSSGLLTKFAEHGLLYDANHFLPYLPIKPFRLWMGLLRIPYNWEDDVHWSYGRAFNDCGLAYGAADLTVFDFHPIHIFLNTESSARYEAAREHYKDPSRLATFRNNGPVLGARDLFTSLLEDIRERQLECSTLAAIERQFVETSVSANG